MTIAVIGCFLIAVLQDFVGLVGLFELFFGLGIDRVYDPGLQFLRLLAHRPFLILRFCASNPIFWMPSVFVIIALATLNRSPLGNGKDRPGSGRVYTRQRRMPYLCAFRPSRSSKSASRACHPSSAALFGSASPHVFQRAFLRLDLLDCPRPASFADQGTFWMPDLILFDVVVFQFRPSARRLPVRSLRWFVGFTCVVCVFHRLFRSSGWLSAWLPRFDMLHGVPCRRRHFSAVAGPFASIYLHPTRPPEAWMRDVLLFAGGLLSLAPDGPRCRWRAWFKTFNFDLRHAARCRRDAF